MWVNRDGLLWLIRGIVWTTLNDGRVGGRDGSLVQLDIEDFDASSIDKSKHAGIN